MSATRRRDAPPARQPWICAGGGDPATRRSRIRGGWYRWSDAGPAHRDWHLGHLRSSSVAEREHRAFLACLLLDVLAAEAIDASLLVTGDVFDGGNPPAARRPPGTASSPRPTAAGRR
ncbi:MAG: hypothetical protein HS111_12450 [Kofleriaceae bacterium]|nr:hypothetical protein [Kofleriaceae bacterium]